MTSLTWFCRYSIQLIDFFLQTFCTVSIRFQKSFIQRFSASSSLFIFPPWNCVSAIFTSFNKWLKPTFYLPPFFTDICVIEWIPKERTDPENQSAQSSVLGCRRKLIRLMDSPPTFSLIPSSGRQQSTYRWTSTSTTLWCSPSSPTARSSPWPSPSTRPSKQLSRHKRRWQSWILIEYFTNDVWLFPVDCIWLATT